MKILLAFLLLVFAFQSCQNKTQKETNYKKTTFKTWKVHQDNYSLTIEIIDSAEFYTHKKATIQAKNTSDKITDYATAKKMLNGIVEFQENGQVAGLRRIMFKNGGCFTNQLVQENFVAYYPSEDIILFEAGHQSDESFDLRNGKETAEVGNPEYIESSPNKEYRLNGYFGGQQCISYFIQKNINGEYYKVFDLFDAFEAAKLQNICDLEVVFWENDHTIFLKDNINFLGKDAPPPAYYKVSIQNAKPPRNKPNPVYKSKNPLDFIPEGFVIHKQNKHDQIKGDFNNDGATDIAMMVKGTDKANFVKNQFGVVVDRNRRGIILLLNKGEQYELAVKNYDCFSSENEDGGVYYAPELDVEFKNAKLFISYRHGRYGYWQYTFRYQNKDFELIGYDASSNRGPIVLSEESIDFLTKEKVIKNNINTAAESDSESDFEESRKSIEVKELIRLSEIQNFDELDLSNMYRIL